jgi:hypothetical protein
MIKNDVGNYFEIGKHANECLNKFNDSLYVQKISKLHDSNSHTIKFSSSNCRYYERGGVEYPLMLLVMILCVHILMICNCIPLLAVI